MKVGASVQGRRKALGLTLDQLASRCDVSRAMISQVERNAKSPTIRVLAELAKGLDCAVSELLSEDERGSLEHLRDGDFQELADPETGALRKALAPRLLRHGIDVVEYTLPAGGTLCNCPARSSDDLVAVYVTQGRLRVVFPDHETVVQRGESVTYTPDVSVDLINAGRGQTRAIMIMDFAQN